MPDAIVIASIKTSFDESIQIIDFEYIPESQSHARFRPDKQNGKLILNLFAKSNGYYQGYHAALWRYADTGYIIRGPAI